MPSWGSDPPAQDPASGVGDKGHVGEPAQVDTSIGESATHSRLGSRSGSGAGRDRRDGLWPDQRSGPAGFAAGGPDRPSLVISRSGHLMPLTVQG